MNFDVKNWIGQVTTGHGAMILGPTLLAAAGGQMSWTMAVPFLVAGVIGLLWPENSGLKTAAQNTATDIEALVTAYRTGLQHGAELPSLAAVTQATGVVLEPAPAPKTGAIATALGMLALCLLGLGVAACSNQTPAQQAANATSVLTITTDAVPCATAIQAAVATAAPNGGTAQALAAAQVAATNGACTALSAATAGAIVNALGNVTVTPAATAPPTAVAPATTN